MWNDLKRVPLLYSELLMWKLVVYVEWYSEYVLCRRSRKTKTSLCF